MGIRFEWDGTKADANLRKHGVTFEEASTVFADYMSLTIYDEDHSTDDEDRFVTMGTSLAGRLLVVVHCDRGDTIRVISARAASRRERMQYGQRH